jgi:2'-5' RNA ligase
MKSFEISELHRHLGLSTMRTFIAIEIDEGTRRRLEDVRRQNWIQGKAVRWARTASMHLTLKFLGEIPPTDVTDVTRAIQNASREIKPFFFETRGLGFFPDAQRPRVFWAGIRDKDGGLAAVHGRLQEELFKVRFEMETRPFSPHLTLARIKGRLDHVRDPGDEDEVFGFQTVSEIVLFKSELRPEGPLYTPLSVVALKE